MRIEAALEKQKQALLGRRLSVKMLEVLPTPEHPETPPETPETPYSVRKKQC